MNIFINIENRNVNCQNSSVYSIQNHCYTDSQHILDNNTTSIQSLAVVPLTDIILGWIFRISFRISRSIEKSSRCTQQLLARLRNEDRWLPFGKGDCKIEKEKRKKEIFHKIAKRRNFQRYQRLLPRLVAVFPSNRRLWSPAKERRKRKKDRTMATRGRHA